ncbi:MAG: YrbL family protein [Pseudoxanthomonas sp.]
MVAEASINRNWQGLEIISRGANRLCARDPQDPAHCLKFELPTGERTRVGLRENMRRWLGRHLPYFGENRTELRAYRKLRARLGRRTDRYLAACNGLVQTVHGPALQCDCALLGDGNPAFSLYRHLFEGPRLAPQKLLAAVDSFEAWLLENDVPLFDLNAGNFVVVASGDTLSLVCVDTKSVLSGKELLPFSRWSRRLMQRKIRRRAQRLRQRITDASTGSAELAGRAQSH